MSEKKPELTPRLMSEIVVNKMKYGGLSPKYQSFLMRCIGNSFVFTTGFIVFLSFIDFGLSMKQTNVSTFVNDFVIVIGFIQICAKYYISCRQAKEISLSIDVVWYEFWSINNGVLNPEERKKMYFVYRAVNTIKNVYSVIVFMAVSLFIIQATIKKSLIINIWLPNKDTLMSYPYFYVIYATQTSILCASVYFSVVQVDTLFILLICFLFVQLKILQKKVLTLKAENSRKVNKIILKECVNQHNKLLQFLENLSFVYGKIFLPAVFTNCGMMTLSLYCLVLEDTLNGKFKQLFIFFAAFSQMFAYCFGGQILQDQGLEIGHSAYHSNWEDIDDINIKKGILMIMTRSQRKMQLSVGGFLILDMERLGVIIKSCFSFITFLSNVK